MFRDRSLFFQRWYDYLRIDGNNDFNNTKHTIVSKLKVLFYFKWLTTLHLIKNYRDVIRSCYKYYFDIDLHLIKFIVFVNPNKWLER